MGKKEKKAFKETGFGKFLAKAGSIVPEVIGAAVKVATGDFKGALADVGQALSGNPSPEAQALLAEFEKHKMDWELEMYRLDKEDRDSARNMRIELAKAGKKDPTHDFLVYAAIGILVLVVLISLFRTLDPFQQKVAIHILGICEGLAIAVYNFEFGSSRGSKDKENKLNKLLDK